MKKIIVTKKNELEEEINSGAMLRLAGVSKNLSNATNIHMAIATIPKDRCSTTHFHTNCESAIYVLSGKGLFLHGNNLEIEEEIYDEIEEEIAEQTEKNVFYCGTRTSDP